MLIEKKDTDYSFGMISDEILYMILGEYGFDDDWIVLPLININKNAIAINKRSETARKAVVLYKNVLYIVKEIPWYTSNEEFTRFEMAYQDEVRKLGSKVPKILRQKDGNLYAVMQSGSQKKFIFVQEYVEGDSWDGTEVCIPSVASALAKLHNDSMSVSEKIKESYCPPYSNVFQLAKKMLDIMFDELNSKRKLTHESDVIEAQTFHDFCMDKSIRLEEESLKDGYGELSIPVHGDYNPWNLILGPEQQDVYGIIDFDNAIIDNPVHDVAEAILDHCYMKYKSQTTRFSGVPDRFLTQYAVSFLKAYKESINFNFDLVLPYLKNATIAVAIELFTLGVVRGDYKISDCKQLMSEIDKIGGFIDEVLEQM